MPKKTITFTVTPDKGTQTYWIAVNDSDVLLVNRTGSLPLEVGPEHFLYWGFTGNSGGTLKIEGKEGAKTLVEMKQSTIPAGRIRGSGVKRFKLS